MRLVTKTLISFFVILTLIFLSLGLFLFSYFNQRFRHLVDEEIVFDEMHWIQFLKNRPEKSAPFELYSPEVRIYPTQVFSQKKFILMDTLILQEFEHEYDPFRELNQVVRVNHQNYSILLRKSLYEKEELIENISNAFLWTFLILVLILPGVIWLINKKIWKPFYSTLTKVKNINLDQLEIYQYPKSSTKEFNELNQAIESMTFKILNDYRILKEFIEDASHEMQTPLAIAQNKLEELIQLENLGDKPVRYIIQATESIQRISKLNQSLLLLAKIENLQFKAEHSLNLGTVLDKYLALFKDFMDNKSLELLDSREEDFILTIHPFLADTLMSNLLGNAIKYNKIGGSIEINLSARQLSIRNSSTLPEIPEETLFKRFKKSEVYTHGVTNGLGLSIIKKIADTHKLNFEYRFGEGFHELKLVKIE